MYLLTRKKTFFSVTQCVLCVIVMYFIKIKAATQRSLSGSWRLTWVSRSSYNELKIETLMVQRVRILEKKPFDFLTFSNVVGSKLNKFFRILEQLQCIFFTISNILGRCNTFLQLFHTLNKFAHPCCAKWNTEWLSRPLSTTLSPLWTTSFFFCQLTGNI